VREDRKRLTRSLLSATSLSGVLGIVASVLLFSLSDDAISEFSILLAYAGVLSSVAPLGREWSILQSQRSQETTAAILTSVIVSAGLATPFALLYRSKIAPFDMAVVVLFGCFYAIGRALRYEAIRVSDSKRVWLLSCVPPLARIVGLLLVRFKGLPIESVFLIESSIRLSELVAFWRKRNVQETLRVLPTWFEASMLVTAALGTATTALLLAWSQKKFSDSATASLALALTAIGLVSQFFSSSFGDMLQRDGVAHTTSAIFMRRSGITAAIVLSATIFQIGLSIIARELPLRWFALIIAVPSAIFAVLSGLTGRIALGDSKSHELIVYNLFWMAEVVLLCAVSGFFQDRSWLAVVMLVNTWGYVLYLMLTLRKMKAFTQDP
jgi:hypothetical protein